MSRRRLLVAAVIAGVVLVAIALVVARPVIDLRYLQGLERSALERPRPVAAAPVLGRIDGLVPLVAHAGGGVGGMTYTNSLEALDAGFAAGCRLFELDFDWAADGELAVIHDFNASVRRLFGPELADHHASQAELLATPRLDGLTQLDLVAIDRWLADHPESYLVSDVKWQNLRGLEVLIEAVSDARRRVIPQVYELTELSPARALGFERVILTLYRSSASDDEVVAFARVERPWAVTMPWQRARGGLPRRLDEVGVAALVHTVNSPRHLAGLPDLGVDGFYTDFLCAWPVVGD